MQHRLRVVPHFSSGIVKRAKRERVKITPREKRRHSLYHPMREKATLSLHAACRLFSRGVIFTRAGDSLALLFLRKNGGLPVVYMQHTYFNISLPSLCDYDEKNAWFHALWRRKRAPRRRNFPSLHFLNLDMVLWNSPPIEFACSLHEVRLLR